MKILSAFVTVGQVLSFGRSINVGNVLLCAETVFREVREILGKVNQTLKQKIIEELEVGKATVCDGFWCLKAKAQFYDLVLRFIELSKQTFTSDCNKKVSTKVLFMLHHDGSKDAFSFRTNIFKKCGISMVLIWDFSLSAFHS